MKKLTEPRATILSIPYKPDNETVKENPPRFSWQPECDEGKYRLQLSQDADFKTNETEETDLLRFNFFVPDHQLEAGRYYWRYRQEFASEISAWSSVRSFQVPEGLEDSSLPNVRERLEKYNGKRPRQYFSRKEVKKLQESNLSENKAYCDFYQTSLVPFLERNIPKEPERYPDDIRVIPLWRKSYFTAQEMLKRIRAFSLAGILEQDEFLIEKAKESLNELADWDTEGSTSRDYNDESAFRVAAALGFGYDWLYDELNEEERAKIKQVLYIRTREIFQHVYNASKIHYAPYDSHAIRALSQVIIPCGLALLGEEEEAVDWLEYAITYFHALYPPWGGADGGWSEGPAYWTTGMAFVIDALLHLKTILGMDLFKRPFFRHTGDFPLYCNPPYTYQASFCDQSNLGKKPSMKIAFNMRWFALLMNNKLYYNYYNYVITESAKENEEMKGHFSETGWWDYPFDEFVFQCYAANYEINHKPEFLKAKLFRDIGWLSFQSAPESPKDNIFFLCKSSPYGSSSHSQADQNTFVLFAYGDPLIINSGYYIGFNSSMHRDWRRQTKSHNTLLIDGKGQYAGMNKAKQLAASGKINALNLEKQYFKAELDASMAYRSLNQDVRKVLRTIYFVQDRYIVILDEVKADKEFSLDFALHTLKPFTKEGSDFFKLQQENTSLDVHFIYASAGFSGIQQTDEFFGADPKETEGLTKQNHFYRHINEAEEHTILTLLIPQKNGEEESVRVIKDDQGMGIYFYFNYDGEVFSLKVNKGLKRTPHKETKER